MQLGKTIVIHAVR